MPLHRLRYQFESSGGNVQYQTTQHVQKEADTHNTEVTLVTTGLSLTSGGIEGTAIVEVSDDVALADVFEAATAIRQLSPDSRNPVTASEQEPVSDPLPDDDIPRFEQSAAMKNLLADVSETPGRGFLLYSNLTRCRPHERDLWLVRIQSTELDATAELTKPDIVEFYREHIGLLEEKPTLKIGGFHGVSEPTIRLSVVASLTDPQEARELAERVNSAGAMNIYRFELSKESLVVGARFEAEPAVLPRVVGRVELAVVVDGDSGPEIVASPLPGMVVHAARLGVGEQVRSDSKASSSHL